MGMTRRQAVVAGLGTLMLGGCAAGGRGSTSGRPTANWPGYPAAPSSGGRYTPVQPPYPQPGVIPGQDTEHAAVAIKAIARSNWTRTSPVKSQINPMNGISKITIHHEGWTAVDFTDRTTTSQRIETIRSVHVRDRGWADIGYHYVIDRAGRVWEGRPIQFQGAHVKENNEHNLGILVLGNFQKQAPSSEQLKSLYETTAQLQRYYRVQPGMVRSHQEINPTTCPGKNLQRHMDALRKSVG